VSHVTDTLSSALVALILRNPRDLVYGVIAVGAMLAAESAGRETYPKTVAAVVVTLVLYWLAHSYAEVAGERLREGGRLTARRLFVTMLNETPILLGAVLPLIAVLICWWADVNLSDAEAAAVWTAAGLVLALELTAGLRARLSGLELLLQALTGAMLGLLIILLRALLH